MYNNRPPVPSSQSTLPYKFNVVELCDRIKEEFSYHSQQFQTAKLEYEKCLQEKTDMQRNYVMYYEMSYGLNVEMHKQSEITKRLNAILAQVLPFLAPEHQSQVSAAVERAKQVTPQELASIISEDSRYPKFSTTVPPNIGGAAEQMEIYKQMQQHAQLVAAVASSNNPNSLVPTAATPSLPGSSHFNSLPSSMPPNSSSAAAAAAAALFGLGNLPPAAAAAMAAMAASGHPSAAAMSAVSTLRHEAEKHHHQQQQQHQAAAMAAALANQLGSNMPPVSVAASLAASFGGNIPVSMEGSGAFVPHDKHRNRSPGHMESSNKRSKIEDSRSEELVVDDDNGEDTLNGDRRQRDSKMRDSGYTPSKSVTPNSSDRSQSGNKGSSTKQTAPFGGGNNAFNPFANGSIPPYMNGMLGGSANPGSELSLPSFLPGVSNGNAMNGFMNPAALASMAASFRPPTMLSTSTANGTPGGLDATAMMRAMAAASNTALPPGVLATSTPSAGANATKYKTNPYCFLHDANKGRFVPIDAFPSDIYLDEIPRRIRPLHSLPHGEVVCAVTFSSSMQHVFTGGKGVVKIWDFGDIMKNVSRSGAPESVSPIISLDCLNKEHYVRSIKYSADSKTIVIGGEANKLSLYDLNSPGNPVCLGELSCQASACYALAVSPNGKLCYSCGADGRISVWDLHNQSLIKEWQAHADGASCIDLGYDETCLWSGGLDNLVRSWDLRAMGGMGGNMNNFIHPRQTFELELPAQVFSLGHSPREHWLAVGLENAMVEMFNYSVSVSEGKSAFSLSENSSRSSTPNSRPSDGRSPIGEPKNNMGSGQYEIKTTYQLGDRYQLALHTSCVLSLKFSHSGKWFMSTGKDNRLHGWRTAVGANLFETKENTSVLTCDVSPDDRYIVTGSGEKKATLYEVIYSHRG